MSLELDRECTLSDGRVENEDAGLVGVSFKLREAAGPDAFDGSGREPFGRGGRAVRRSRK